MPDHSLALRLKNRIVGCLRGEIAQIDRGLFVFIMPERERVRRMTLALFLTNTAEERVELLWDKRGFDLISDALPFGRLWYAEPNAVTDAIGYAEHRSRSHDAVIRVYDETGNVIETHEHKGDFREPLAFTRAGRTFCVNVVDEGDYSLTKATQKEDR
jgi:hypothetical protein